MYRAKSALFSNFDKLRLTRADYSLRVCKTVHVNGNPTTVQEYEVRIPDQPEMAGTVSLHEELLRMAAKAEHFAMTRSELFLVHRCRSIRVHVRLASANVRVRTCPRFSPYMGATLNICIRLAAYVRA